MAEINATKVYGPGAKPFCKATRVYRKGMKFDHDGVAQGSYIAFDDTSTPPSQVSFNLYANEACKEPFVGERYNAHKNTQPIPKDSAARLSERGYVEITDRKAWPKQVIPVVIEVPKAPETPKTTEKTAK